MNHFCYQNNLHEFRSNRMFSSILNFEKFPVILLLNVVVVASIPRICFNVFISGDELLSSTKRGTQSRSSEIYAYEYSLDPSLTCLFLGNSFILCKFKLCDGNWFHKKTLSWPTVSCIFIMMFLVCAPIPDKMTLESCQNQCAGENQQT